jgi:hypothetical protein
VVGGTSLVSNQGLQSILVTAGGTTGGILVGSLTVGVGTRNGHALVVQDEVVSGTGGASGIIGVGDTVGDDGNSGTGGGVLEGIESDGASSAFIEVGTAVGQTVVGLNVLGALGILEVVLNEVTGNADGGRAVGEAPLDASSNTGGDGVNSVEVVRGVAGLAGQNSSGAGAGVVLNAVGNSG